MLVKHSEPQCICVRQGTPRAFWVGRDSFGEAVKLETLKSLPKVLAVVVHSLPSGFWLFTQNVFESLYQIPPDGVVVECFQLHMSGLLGPFRVEKKATTDALDTHNA
ncbi:hypothetical protein [Pseudomonas fluorescens]|uniref:hypothetical protein n=1 Tax=Pseudomonas TaxID=286 RepID=UPI00146D76D0|nr:hypothetical protein [Pseudomonas fluorescens]